jgi:hypothetical protein
MIQKPGNIFKKGAALFLWIAMIIIMAHSIIPHDHHTEYTGSIPDRTCNAPENEAGHHHSIPLHCHALNDLVCEKFTFSFLKLHHSSTNYLPLSAQLVSVAIFRTCRLVTFHAGPIPLFSPELTASDPFRAPPIII